MRSRLFFACVLLVGLASSCDDLNDSPPTGPTVAPVPASQYAIAGDWNGISNQGRPLQFQVNDQTQVVNATITLHHDCTGGRLVLPLGGFEAQVSGDSFSVTINWRVDEGVKFYTGRLTVSGRFEGSNRARGGFVNGITDKRPDNLGVCPSSSGSWEATRN
jgi:hypothetical protein